MKALMSIHLFGVVAVSLLIGSSAWGTTIYWETPEEVITRAPTIVHARVTTVELKSE